MANDNETTISKKNHKTDIITSVLPAVVHEKIAPKELVKRKYVKTRHYKIDHYQHRILPVNETKFEDDGKSRVDLPTEVTNIDQSSRDKDEEQLKKLTKAEDLQVVLPKKEEYSEDEVIEEECYHHVVHETIRPIIMLTTEAVSVVEQYCPIIENITAKGIIHNITIEKPIDHDEYDRLVELYPEPVKSSYTNAAPNVIPAITSE